MNCEMFEKILCDLDRADVLPSAVREAALAHAETCAPCGLLMTESESLDMHLRTLSISARIQSPPPRVESALLEEFREFHEEQRRGRRRWQLAALGVAAAAALAVSYFLLGHFVPGRNPMKDAQDTSTHSGAPTTAPIASTARDSNESAHAQEASGTNTPKRLAPVANPSAGQETAAEQGTAFIPLPYADSAAEIEGGEVVRVILSPAALEAMGLRSSDFSSSGDVSADLLVDEAGTPEAIRLVAQSDKDSVPN